ncbi:hypothetical protein HPB48_012047 [Haemaphysalis longicornis]|uniref:Uncharacterized protein n=1 Tax=Haemaphysalis longicornis TaxID=44386 RepID=A0A9J6GBL2_HAELO|nr:hypothetical protein HPB48_012047 [Haemaphysalis longicornis]
MPTTTHPFDRDSKSMCEWDNKYENVMQHNCGKARLAAKAFRSAANALQTPRVHLVLHLKNEPGKGGGAAGSWPDSAGGACCPASSSLLAALGSCLGSGWGLLGREEGRHGSCCSSSSTRGSSCTSQGSRGAGAVCGASSQSVWQPTLTARHCRRRCCCCCRRSWSCAHHQKEGSTHSCHATRVGPLASLQATMSTGNGSAPGRFGQELAFSLDGNPHALLCDISFGTDSTLSTPTPGCTAFHLPRGCAT